MFGFRPHRMHTSTPWGLWKAHNTVIYSVLRSRQFYLSALCRAEVCARTRTKAYNTPTNIRKFPLDGKYLHLFFNKTHHGFNKNFHGRDFYRFSANISMRKRAHKPPNTNNFYPRKFKSHIPELFWVQSPLALLVVPSFIIRPPGSEKVKFA